MYANGSNELLSCHILNMHLSSKIKAENRLKQFVDYINESKESGREYAYTTPAIGSKLMKRKDTEENGTLDNSISIAVKNVEPFSNV